jgi:hypothetical protein
MALDGLEPLPDHKLSVVYAKCPLCHDDGTPDEYFPLTVTAAGRVECKSGCDAGRIREAIPGLGGKVRGATAPRGLAPWHLRRNPR